MLKLSTVPDFDPQKVPVHATDSHLPRLNEKLLTLEALELRFQSPVPIGQGDWQDDFEGLGQDLPRQRAAVLIGIVQRARGPQVLLTQRAAHMRTHSGQVAFPGGKVDPSDSSIEFTALREAQEEVGLEAGYVKILGRLPDYVTFANMLVSPVVALIEPEFTLKINPEEVARVFEVPLHFLMNPTHHQQHRLEFKGQFRSWYSIAPHEATQGAFIWGATASMIRGLYQFLVSDETMTL